MAEKKIDDSDPNTFFKFSFPIILIIVLIMFILVTVISSFSFKSKFDNFNRSAPTSAPKPSEGSTVDKFYTDYGDLQDIINPEFKINPNWVKRCTRITLNKQALNDRKVLRRQNSDFKSSFLYDEDYYRSGKDPLTINYFNYTAYNNEVDIYDSDMVDTNLILQTGKPIQYGINTTSTLLEYDETPSKDIVTKENSNRLVGKKYNVAVFVNNQEKAKKLFPLKKDGEPNIELKFNNENIIDAVSIYSLSYDVKTQTLIFSATGTSENIYGNTTELTTPTYYLYGERQSGGSIYTPGGTTNFLNDNGTGYLYFKSSCCEQKLIIKQKTVLEDPSKIYDFSVNIYYQGNTNVLVDSFYIADLKSPQLIKGELTDVANPSFTTDQPNFYIIEGGTPNAADDYKSTDDFLTQYISIYPFLQNIPETTTPRLYEIADGAGEFNEITDKKDVGADLQNPSILYIFNFDSVEDASRFINNGLNFIKSGSQQFVIFEREIDGIYVNRFYPYSTFGIYRKKDGTKYVLRFVIMKTTYLDSNFLIQ